MENNKRYIKIKNVKIEVDIDTYKEIDKLNKRQKYHDEVYVSKKSQFNEEVLPSHENVQNHAIKEIYIQKLNNAIEKLTDEERHIIFELFYMGVSERVLAKDLKVHYMTIHKRKEKILKKLKNFIEK